MNLFQPLESSVNEANMTSNMSDICCNFLSVYADTDVYMMKQYHSQADMPSITSPHIDVSWQDFLKWATIYHLPKKCLSQPTLFNLRLMQTALRLQKYSPYSLSFIYCVCMFVSSGTFCKVTLKVSCLYFRIIYRCYNTAITLV